MSDRPPQVVFVLGSHSDLIHFEEAFSTLDRLDIPWECRILSAHRTPEEAAELASNARVAGVKVLIAGAGCAAHLAGALASRTTLPVLGIPIAVPPLEGLDALLSTVQMPAGIPVGTFAIGKAGATNAALFAAQIMGVEDDRVRCALDGMREEMRESVRAKDASVRHEKRRG